MTSRTVSGRVRIGLDFPTPEAALKWVDWLRSTNPRYDEVDAYAMDGLDTLSHAGITTGHTYLLKNNRDRIPGSALRDLWDGKHNFNPANARDTHCVDCEGLERSPLHRVARHAASQ